MNEERSAAFGGAGWRPRATSPGPGENRAGMAHNFVTVGPRKIVMPSGNPRSEGAFRGLGIEVLAVDVREIREAAGAIGCLTGILARKPATHGPDGAV